MPEPSTNSMVYAETAGLILAGGEGMRLGKLRKADLLVGGHRLLDVACGNLGGQTHHIIIATGDQPLHPPSQLHRYSFVADPGQGPAAAMLLAAREIKKHAPDANFLLVAPCDAPFMPPNFLELARADFEGTVDVIVGAFGGRTFPTHALWRLSALQDLQSRFTPTDNPSIFALLDCVAHRLLGFDTHCPENPFFNINTPADLLAANRRFAGNSDPSFS